MIVYSLYFSRIVFIPKLNFDHAVNTKLYCPSRIVRISLEVLKFSPLLFQLYKMADLDDKNQKKLPGWI